MEWAVLESIEGQHSCPMRIVQGIPVLRAYAFRKHPQFTDMGLEDLHKTINFLRTDEAILVDGKLATIYRQEWQ